MGVSIGVVCSEGIGSAHGGRDNNEDNYLVADGGIAVYRDGRTDREEPADGVGSLVAVCDGMGGHERGEVASLAAARALARLYAAGRPDDAQDALRRFVLKAHTDLHARAREAGRANMGTTLTAVWLVDHRAGWVHVGDSRLYLYRNDELTQLTTDHTRNEFARRDGRADLGEEGEHLAQSFIFGSRGLGSNATLRIDVGLDTGCEFLRRDDVLLLCSDGLTAAVDDGSIAEVLRRNPEPQAAAVACMERAIARGTLDNVTVVVVRVDDLPDDSWAGPDFEEDVGDEPTFILDDE